MEGTAWREASQFVLFNKYDHGPGYSSWYSNSLQAGWSGDWIPEGARFSAPIQTSPGAHPVSYKMGTGSFLWVKQPGRGTDHPPPYSTKVKEREDLYLYSPSGPLWPVLGWNLPLPLPYLINMIRVMKSSTMWWWDMLHTWKRRRRHATQWSANHLQQIISDRYWQHLTPHSPLVGVLRKHNPVGSIKCEDHTDHMSSKQLLNKTSTEHNKIVTCWPVQELAHVVIVFVQHQYTWHVLTVTYQSDTHQSICHIWNTMFMHKFPNSVHETATVTS